MPGETLPSTLGCREEQWRSSRGSPSSGRYAVRWEKHGTGDPDSQLLASAPGRSALVLGVQRKTAYLYLGKGQEICEDIFVENWAFQSVVLGMEKLYNVSARKSLNHFYYQRSY